MFENPLPTHLSCCAEGMEWGLTPYPYALCLFFLRHGPTVSLTRMHWIPGGMPSAAGAQSPAGPVPAIRADLSVSPQRRSLLYQSLVGALFGVTLFTTQQKPPPPICLNRETEKVGGGSTMKKAGPFPSRSAQASLTSLMPPTVRVRRPDV